LWNVFSRGTIIMASTIFYPTNRWYTHITIMSISLFFTFFTRPYIDNESNYISILFCVIDVLGAISAWQSSNAFLTMVDDQGNSVNNVPTPGFQTLFVMSLMFALLVVVVLALKAMKERIRILHDAMIHGTDNQSIWKVYTKCEVIFLFPILVIVFFVSFIAKVLCTTFNSAKNKNRPKLASVVPEINKYNQPPLPATHLHDDDKVVLPPLPSSPHPQSPKGDVISTNDLKEAPKFTFTTSSTTIIVPEGNTILLKDGQTMTNAWYGKDLTQGALVPIDNISNGTSVGNGMGIGDPVPGYPKKLWINIKSINGGDESFVMNFGEYVSKPEKYNWNGSHAVYSGNYGGAFDQDPEKEGWVVFNVSTKTGGIHDLYFSYTAYDSRPCIVRVNGQTVPQTCANNTTGGWGCATIVWSKKPECRIDMGPAGSVTKLEIRSVHFMPHLAEMKFIHVNDNENASAVT
jgi:uncharacterized Tic20 family protein